MKLFCFFGIHPKAFRWQVQDSCYRACAVCSTAWELHESWDGESYWVKLPFEESIRALDGMIAPVGERK